MSTTNNYRTPKITIQADSIEEARAILGMMPATPLEEPVVVPKDGVLIPAFNRGVVSWSLVRVFRALNLDESPSHNGMYHCNKVAAIKAVRELTDLGLEETKKLIEGRL
jgi:hypothetical protein